MAIDSNKNGLGQLFASLNWRIDRKFLLRTASVPMQRIDLCSLYPGTSQDVLFTHNHSIQLTAKSYVSLSLHYAFGSI